MFNQSEFIRYSRQFAVGKIGLEGQERLKNAKVLCVGAGGIGSPALYYLAAAGIGKIGVIDFDNVELSNLQRQILFSESDLNQPKAQVAANKLHSLNSNIIIESYDEKLSLDNAEKLIVKYDVVLDGSDNYKTRYLTNDVCCYLRKPLVSASIFQFSGQLGVFNYKNNACYRCMFPSAPSSELVPNCAEAGVLGVVPGIIGCMAVAEIIKLILNLPSKATRNFISFNSLTLETKYFQLVKDKECRVCAKHEKLSNLHKIEKISEVSVDEVSVFDLQRIINEEDNFELLDVRQPWECEICSIKGSINIPLENLEKRINEIKRCKKLIVYCKSGKRSEKAFCQLKLNGFKKVCSLEGGILAWINQVEGNLNKY